MQPRNSYKQSNTDLFKADQLSRSAILVLAGGKVYKGKAFGASKSFSAPAIGELVFNTSQYGYQEILTDPSYAGQMMCFTNPQIGNVGCNQEDNESSKVHVEAAIIRELSPLSSNFRSEQTLDQYLKAANVMGISAIDTRDLVIELRTKGAQVGVMCEGSPTDIYSERSIAELTEIARSIDYAKQRDYVSEVTCKKSYGWSRGAWTLPSAGSIREGIRRINEPDNKPDNTEQRKRPHLVALDCGIKYNILDLLVSSGFQVTVVPAHSSAAEIMALNPQALFLSNGPGDPSQLTDITRHVTTLLGRIPIFGICLGHQILAQAVGGRTYKLKFGHRGGNHPVRDERTRKVEITVQNHGYAVEESSLPKEVEVSHINLNDGTIEGLNIPDAKAFSVQYHPEASPGPHDALYLFERFYNLVTS